jgi:L-iditol 2-dehydrogenase
MKAAVFKGIGNIQIVEVDKPKCDHDGIIVKVEACGICGSDIRNFHFGLKDNITNQIMGHEISGVVEKVGNEITRFKIGNKVAIAPDVSCGKCYYCEHGFVNLCVNHRMIGTHWPGGFAEYVSIPAEILTHGIIHHMPEGLSFEAATLSEPLSSVIAAQHNINTGLGDTVLIIGDGPIGCLHLEIARARGVSKVIMVGLKRLKIAAGFNPDYLVDAASQDPVEEVLKNTNNLGADVAICANPIAATQEQAIESVRKRGKVIFFGGLPKLKPMTSINSNLIHYNELSIIGSFSYPAWIHKLALLLIRDRKITPEKYVNKIVPLKNIDIGFAAAESGDVLKVLIKP